MTYFHQKTFLLLALSLAACTPKPDVPPRAIPAPIQTAAVYDCRMNNSSNDADGLHSNVTNLVSSAGNVVSNSVK